MNGLTELLIVEKISSVLTNDVSQPRKEKESSPDSGLRTVFPSVFSC